MKNLAWMIFVVDMRSEVNYRYSQGSSYYCAIHVFFFIAPLYAVRNARASLALSVMTGAGMFLTLPMRKALVSRIRGDAYANVSIY